MSSVLGEQALLVLVEQVSQRLEQATARLVNCELELNHYGQREAALTARVVELEKLWAVARENPELVRELAVEALKGHSAVR